MTEERLAETSLVAARALSSAHGRDVYQRTFAEERGRSLTGLGGGKPGVPAPPTSAVAIAIPMVAATADPDETVIGALAPAGAPLPFVPGSFKPAPSVAEAPVVRPPFDPDATLQPVLNSDETLPFVKILPSQTLKGKPR